MPDSYFFLALAGLQMAPGPVTQPRASAQPAEMSSNTSLSITLAAGSIEPMHQSRDPTRFLVQSERYFLH